MQAVPVSLTGIFVILFIMFSNARDTHLVLANVPFAIIGGIIALHLTGRYFGISTGVGFLPCLEFVSKMMLFRLLKVVSKTKLKIKAPYSGTNILTPNTEIQGSIIGTLFTGSKLWKNTEH